MFALVGNLWSKAHIQTLEKWKKRARRIYYSVSHLSELVKMLGYLSGIIHKDDKHTQTHTKKCTL